MKRSTTIVMAIFSVTLLGSGCAAKQPSFGDSIKSEGLAVAGIGEKWEKGQALIKKGNKQIRKGNRLIDEGQEDITEGKANVKSGQKLVDDSERAYDASARKSNSTL